MSLTISAPLLSDRLKVETHFLHTRAEDLMQPRLGAIHDPASYAAVLRMFYGFFNPLQNLVASHISPVVLEDFAERNHAELILSDLEAIGCSLEPMPLCHLLPEVCNTAQALGALYVMEGSTLGGRYIRKMLLKHPHIQLREDQLRFFNGYGEYTGTKWKTFQAAVNRYNGDAETILASANQTFQLFADWILTHAPHESDKI